MKFLLFFIFCTTYSCVFGDEAQDWWKHTEIYDVFPWSFKDSNGDGIGDLNGITMSMDYFLDMGISTLKLSPIYPSPDDISSTYGVTDFTNIHPTLGNLKDFDNLVDTATSKGIKIILDIIFNHCHVEHEWFKKSVDKEGRYTDYFTWTDPKKTSGNIEPPNSWTAKNGRVAWELNAKRNQFYYFHYDPFSADLNLRNKDVKNEIMKIMEFWIERGVSGFNLLGAEAYMEDKSLNEKSSLTDHPDTFEFLYDLREYFDLLNKNNPSGKRILMVDSRPTEDLTLKYIGNIEYPLAHMVSNKLFTSGINYSIKAQELDTMINSTINYIKDGLYFAWQSENTEVVRITKRINRQYADLVLTLSFLLPGVTYLYYGQELGMCDTQPFSERHIGEELRYQNEHALPMQWDDSENAGFSYNENPLQRPNPDYWKINVVNQKNQKISTYNMVKNLIKLRKREAFMNGDFTSYILSEWVYGFTRATSDSTVFITILNLGNVPQLIDYQKFSEDIPQLPTLLTVVAASPNSIYQKGDKINTRSKAVLRPLSTVVVGVMKKYSKE